MAAGAIWFTGAGGADEVYVNGDSFVPGARALEGLFTTRLFAAVEA